MTLRRLPHVDTPLPNPLRFVSIEPIPPEQPTAHKMIHEVWDLDQRLKAAVDPELQHQRKETHR